jgi:hypothetical protein
MAVMINRAVIAAIVTALVACSTAPHDTTTVTPTPTGRVIDAADGSRCTVPDGLDGDHEREACTARGADCVYVQELTCRGIDVSDEQHEEERRASEAGEVPCACVCPDDRQRCAEVP